MTRIENVKQGKYYADKTSAIRVDGFDTMDDPFGLCVIVQEDWVGIYQQTDLDFYFLNDNQMKEITRAEFYEWLEKAKSSFITMTNNEISRSTVGNK